MRTFFSPSSFHRLSNWTYSSVKVWYDAKCRISDIFGAPYSPYRCGCNQNIKVAEGINVVFKGWAQDGAPAQGMAVSNTSHTSPGTQKPNKLNTSRIHVATMGGKRGGERGEMPPADVLTLLALPMHMFRSIHRIHVT